MASESLFALSGISLAGFALLGYAFGCIPCSYLASRMLGQIDIRNYGSGNTGATNVYRVLGKKAGIIAFIGDFLKGLLPALIGNAIAGQEAGAIAALFAVIGHCYPVTLKFRGGKGVATSAGMIFGTAPLIGVILIVLQFAILFVTKYMSLASIISAVLFPILVYFSDPSPVYQIASILMGLLVIFRHHSNIRKLLKGEESKMGSKKNKA
ncbi:glycerol-3-phosphate 1-O-acyltransferase PlsY [Acidaminobacter hydrogenoformans]|uniref:Glycerol-3-phosphate acyltransferase n=1 Tax=Acidaminobacter hydrogenoformans DSM 2784 TaxID=1120920 RepID=A0A1G5RSW6_9FIRM|nr:glycerol-3-phosphate 1-O-acyltransferase PlsY [Acidaminobacter hydrogenoformans]SCZ77182.1 acyl-phosphate glycerol-3-phosphate acyltransferase [Acidaminobacter hydrogenoformans DSM 2784]